MSKLTRFGLILMLAVAIKATATVGFGLSFDPTLVKIHGVVFFVGVIMAIGGLFRRPSE